MPFDAIARDGIFAHTLDMMYLAETNEKHLFNYNSIDRIGTSRYSCLDIITICGDSYSIQLHNYIASALNVSVPIYAYPGQSIVENEELYNKAIDSSSKVIVLSTSVNDVMD